MSAEFVKQFAAYGGIAGLLMLLIIMGMSGAIVMLWKHIAKIQDSFTALQEQRVKETNALNEKTIILATQLHAVVQETTSTVRSLKDAVTALRTSVDSLRDTMMIVVGNLQAK